MQQRFHHRHTVEEHCTRSQHSAVGLIHEKPREQDKPGQILDSIVEGACKQGEAAREVTLCNMWKSLLHHY